MAGISQMQSIVNTTSETLKKSTADIRSQSVQLEKVSLPRTESSNHSVTSGGVQQKGNPFKIPADSDIFLLRDKEKQRRKAERLRQQKLHVHEKSTYSSKVNFRPISKIYPAESESEEEEETDKAVAVKDDPQFTIAITKDRYVEKESLAQYIAKKREMFLVQYSLGVKRDEMRKLEEIAQAEEKKLELAEQYLEEDAAMFDEFLKENDKNSVEAIKIAESEAKLKLEKVGEIKRINAQMMGIKSEIAKYEDTLKEYEMYRHFLESLIPQEIKEERNKERERKREKFKAASVTSEISVKQTPKKSMGSAAQRKSVKGSGLLMRGSVDRSYEFEAGRRKTFDDNDESTFMDDFYDSDEDLDLYFTDPQQLLDIFSELEEQNLSLIQNSQETEEALEEMKSTIKKTKIKMEKETKTLTEQISKLQAQIQKEEAKASDLKIKAKMFNYGEFKADDDQEQHLNELNKKVEGVYRNCIGDNEANISTLQMLTNIENRLEELFEIIETMPPDKVEAAEKAKDKERRLKLREEKLEQLRIHQEERIRKALERAQAAPKKQTGRKLVYRSEPPQLARKEDEGVDVASKEEEELQYYFSW